MNPTAAQRHAINSDAKEILVVAGPGSGKTATTVKRIKRLVIEGVSPRKIVVLTFTNAAAREIEARLDQHGILGIYYVGTLHGFALRMLKQYGETIGYGARMALIGEETVADLLAAKAKQLSCKTPLKKLLKLKNEIKTGPVFREERLTETERVLLSYREELREAGLVDFDTILSEFLKMLLGWNESRLGTLGFTHLFVDEVQDSARIDWDIYQALPVANKFYVGDPDQSIYAFRGGRPDLMLAYAKRPGVAVITLEDNFRSHSEICDAAQRLIEGDKDRINKVTRSVKGTGGEAQAFAAAANPGHECGMILALVRAAAMPPMQVLDDPLDHESTPSNFSEIAVLARTNDVCIEIRDQLRSAGIPVAEAAKSDLPHDWALAKAMVELMVNPFNDTMAYFYCIARDRVRFGYTDDEARKHANSLLQVARAAMQPMAQALMPAWLRVAPVISTVGPDMAAAGITAETRMRVASIVRLLPVDADLLHLALALASDQGQVEDQATKGVNVLTFHGSKGREFDTVILAGMEDEILPGAKEHELQDARRLVYVGATRARNQLYLTHSTSRRTSWGIIETHKRSRFVKEMGL